MGSRSGQQDRRGHSSLRSRSVLALQPVQRAQWRSVNGRSSNWLATDGGTRNATLLALLDARAIGCWVGKHA